MTEKLLQALGRHANHQGTVIVREPALLEELGISSEGLRVELEHLERGQAIRTLSPLPFLVLKLRKWPGDRGDSAESAPNAYSYSKLFKKTAAEDSYRPDQQGADDLLQEILETLGEQDPASFRKALELYAPKIIRTALDRVRRAKHIRKNRTALFRHLLPRIARESQST